jgi:transcriptional antiterminator NusG
MSSHKWYAVQVHSGSELAVKRGIESLVKDLKVEDRLSEILVPTEDLIVVKNGNKKIVEKSLYPGYVFIKIDLDTNLWHRIQSLAKVGRFIGEAKKPTQLTEKDINTIIDKVTNKAAPKPKIFFEAGEMVRIKEGPFANFNGMVEEYDMESGKLKLNVSIFSRGTPVEIMYNQVERIV